MACRGEVAFRERTGQVASYESGSRRVSCGDELCRTVS